MGRKVCFDSTSLHPSLLTRDKNKKVKSLRCRIVLWPQNSSIVILYSYSSALQPRAPVLQRIGKPPPSSEWLYAYAGRLWMLLFIPVSRGTVTFEEVSSAQDEGSLDADQALIDPDSPSNIQFSSVTQKYPITASPGRRLSYYIRKGFSIIHVFVVSAGHDG